MKSWLLAKPARWRAALLLLALALVGLRAYRRLPEVGVAEAQFGALTLSIAASGQVDGTASDLGFGISGRVSDVYVREGEEIVAEQPLARVEPVGGFMDGGPGSDVIRAPFDGWVVSITQRQGGAVAQGLPVLRVVKRERPWVTAFVDAEDAAAVKPGAPFVCRAGGYLARPWRLEVTAVGHEAVPREDVPGSARQVRIALKPLDADFSLAIGTPVDIDGEVPLVTHGLLIPAAAIVRANGGSFVWTLNGGRVHQREVTTGPSNFRQVVVLDGLAAGETVVAEHKHELREGLPVRAVPWTAGGS